MSICKVIISNKQKFSKQLELLSYFIPESLRDGVEVGTFVRVPFGKLKENGLVVDLYTNPTEEDQNYKLRDIEEILSDGSIFSHDLIELIKFIAEYYCCPSSEVLEAVMPSGLIKKPEKEVSLNISPELLENDLKLAANPIMQALLKARNNKAKYPRLKALSKLNSEQLKQELNKLKKQDLVSIQYLSKQQNRKKQSKDPINRLGELESAQKPKLTDQQEEVLEKFTLINKASTSAPKFILRGVTGSGKTEVYLRLIEEMLKTNPSQSALVLVPEISLAPQMIERLSQRFGKEKVTIWHSALNDSEKEHSYNAILSQEAKIIVGARSAVLAPIRNTGLIIVDEEHENSYKQDSPSPRYHARTVAIKRAELCNCPIIFGSATPSIELYHKAISETHLDFHLLELSERVFKNPLPTVKVVDMREEFLEGNKSIFSKSLHNQIEKALENKEQVILFLNKRGSASHVFCRTCGYVYKCNNCDSKMVYHQNVQQMICHHCGHKDEHPEECPECSMPTIRFFGLGTQKLESETQRAFPEARIARLDSDTSKIKHSYLKIWQAFKKQEIDILIGTQMIAKGLDLPKLNTVGVISADSNFSQLDYQADERGFQLLTQVAGRAGRSDQEGFAIFQTYQPDREVLLKAKDQDYEEFYEHEIKAREEYCYPPFSTLIRFVSSSEDEALAIETANQFHELIYNLESFQASNTRILGPSPCMMSRLNKKYRYHILLKIPHGENTAQAIDEAKEIFKGFKKSSRVTFTIDIDNVNLY